MIIRANANGESIHLKRYWPMQNWEVNFSIFILILDGHPSAAIVLKQNYGSNANEVIEKVKAKLEEMKETFPPGLDYKISYDVSKFLRCFY